MDDRKKTIGFLGTVFFLFLASNSFWMYANNYFREIGFDSTQLGLITAIGNCIAMIGLPFLGLLSDKLRSPRRVFAALAVMMIPVHLLFPALGGALGKAAYVPILMLCVLGTLGRQGGNSLLDSWIGGEMERLGASFGTIRRYGSASFVIGSVIASLLIGPVLPTWVCFLFVSALFVPILLLTLSHKGGSHGMEATDEPPAKAGVVLKYVFSNYYFVTYLLMVMAFDAFLGILNLDMSYLMDYVGTDRANVGYVGAVRASTEVVLMIIIGRQKKLPPYWILLAISGVFVAAEMLLYPLATSVVHIMLFTLCSGIAGGLFYGLGANYVFKIVDHHACGTAMAVLGVTKSLVGIIGSGIGGIIIAEHGVLTLTTGVGILSMGLTILFFLSCILGRYVLKIPYVSEKQPI